MPNEADMNIMKVEVKESDALKVVFVTRDGDRLLVTIEGPDVETVTGPTARNLAYKERLNHGYNNAGLEAFGGPYPFDKKNSKDLSTHEEIMDASNRMKDLVYRCQYRLTPGL
jgi:hypothetical protein